MSPTLPTETDLLVVGGGINGAGIARDAAGRGLSVVLAERGDLGCATSSASSKLIHGGLRYLEHLQLRLVAEALSEREVLLRIAPQLVRAMRFILPSAAEARPEWMLRAGLRLYDFLARKGSLPRWSAVALEQAQAATLRPQYRRGYAYYDACVDDARLVIANALSARELGAHVMPRTECVALERTRDRWRVRLRRGDTICEVSARAVVNAAGPWADELLERAAVASPRRLRLVQGSHIVVPRLFEEDHAFILQNEDRRVIFVYPYEGHTLIGTTDVELTTPSREPAATPAEIEYLCRSVNRYFDRELDPGDVVWSYAGIRALVDHGPVGASRLSRDYELALDAASGKAPLLSVLGGKITTYRRLAERALDTLRPLLPSFAEAWTANAALPGGDLPDGGLPAYVAELASRYPRLPSALLEGLARRHGSQAPTIIGTAASVADLGEHFGAHLYAAEVDHFVRHEWASDAGDVLWRRTKAGLHLSAEQQAKVRSYLAGCPAAL